jgi:uncharacterized membrane protein YhaH (DUF805 family)
MSFVDLFFSFKGRIGRLVYFVLTLVLIVVEVASFLVLNIISQNLNSNYSSMIITLLFIIGFAVMGVVAWSSLVITVKRLHDRDKSGWWMFMGLLPLIGPFWVTAELFLLRGTDGPNRFGAKASEIRNLFEKAKAA